VGHRHRPVLVAEAAARRPVAVGRGAVLEVLAAAAAARLLPGPAAGAAGGVRAWGA
jgi:hypothetical protein